MVVEDFGKILRKLCYIRYGDLAFKAICPTCGEPVELDDSISIDSKGDFIKRPNATCGVHGRVEMPFGGKFIV